MDVPHSFFKYSLSEMFSKLIFQSNGVAIAMRIINLLIVASFVGHSSARGVEAIAPGMSLADVEKTLNEYGYEVDALKYGLAMDTDDKKTALDFCRIDKNITLVLEFDTDTKEVLALDLYFFPDQRIPKLYRQMVVRRRASEIRFEKDGVYTLKLKRERDTVAPAK